MTPEQSPRSSLANLSRDTPLDLDPLIFDASPDRHSDISQPVLIPPSTALWRGSGERSPRIGIRIREPLLEAHFLAARLAAIAFERHVVPVFLNHVASSGMQGFGFRVEYISGSTEAEREFCEQQIKRFWNLAIVVDAVEIDQLS